MHNSWTSLWHELRRKPNFKLHAYIAGGVFALICAFFVVLALTPHQRLHLHQTPYNTADSNVWLSQSGDMYAYQGGVFWRHSLSRNDSEILAAGIKLPELRTVVWGEEGAFIVPAYTEPYRLVGTALEGENAASYYIDFASQEVHAVDARADSYAYMRGSVFVGALGNELWWYDVNQGEVTEHVIDVHAIESVHACTDDRACIVAMNSDNSYTLHAVGDDGELDELVGNVDYITPTSQPDVFAVSQRRDDQPSDHAQAIELGDTTFYHVREGFLSPDVDLGGEQHEFMVASNTSLAALTPNRVEYVSVARTYFGWQQTRTTRFGGDGEMLGMLHASSAGAHALGFNGGGDIVLITTHRSLRSLTPGDVDSVLEQCSAYATFEYDDQERTLRVLVEVEDEAYTTAFLQAGECLQMHASDLAGLTFQFSAVATDGRIILI